MGLQGLLMKYRCMFSFLIYFCTSINVANLFNVLGGTYLSPLSSTAFSVFDNRTLLRLKIPVPFKLFVFFVRARRPPLEPLLVLFPWDGLPGPGENPPGIPTWVDLDCMYMGT